MKLLHVTVQFQYAEMIEAILDRHEVESYVRYPTVYGRDCDGKHQGSKVFPGNFSVLQALVPDDRLEAVLDQLRSFRGEREAHNHLRAVAVAVEGMIGPEGEERC